MTHSDLPLRLAAVGDVMLARDVGRHFADAPHDFTAGGVHDVLRTYDVVCANLENPVGTSGHPCPGQDPQVTFRAHPATLDVLLSLGVTVVSLGNNHMLDYGEPALIETLEHLDRRGIRWVGAGRDYEEANRPLLMHVRGRRLAFLSYAFIYSVNSRMATRRRPGIADHRLSRILSRIRQLTRAGHQVVVMCHWGFEYCFYPLPYQMRAARRMIDVGATLVLGHGPHYPQGLEQYRDREIVYSLGNFIFDEPHKYANRSFIYGVDIDRAGGLRRHEILPVHLRRHIPTLVEGAEKRRVARLIENLSTRYVEKDQGFWRSISASYLTNLCGRVARTRSFKYLFVPPMSFYRDVGPSPILRRLKPSSVMRLLPFGSR
jgi:poly-gamma-glutamate capsule biosynthesis protein CapA/YwtB (metallophosphatase superfamily)